MNCPCCVRMKDLDLIEKILLWHVETFKNATYETQCEKLTEELNEYRMALTYEDRDGELADIAIVAIGMMRWNPIVGIQCYKVQFKEAERVHIDLYKSIEEKMKINKSRAWQETKGGYYHHKDIDK